MVKCCGVGRKVWTKIRKTPPKYAIFGGEKIIVSETEDKLILGIPLVVRLRPIVVQPQTINVSFQLEDIGIAIPVGAV